MDIRLSDHKKLKLNRNTSKIMLDNIRNVQKSKTKTFIINI